MAVNQDTLYVKGDRNVEVTKREVTLGDLVSMECSNRVILPHLKTMKVLKFRKWRKAVCDLHFKDYCVYP